MKGIVYFFTLFGLFASQTQASGKAEGLSRVGAHVLGLGDETADAARLLRKGIEAAPAAKTFALGTDEALAVVLNAKRGILRRQGNLAKVDDEELARVVQEAFENTKNPASVLPSWIPARTGPSKTFALV